MRTSLISDHHRDLDRAFAALLEETYGDDPRELCTHWDVFDQAIEAHLQAEEEMLFPRFGGIAPAELAHLVQDHDRIRALMTALGVEVELHVIRAGTLRSLIEALRHHANREDAFLYPWAERNLPTSELAQLRGRLTSIVDLTTSPRL